ncbi:MAG: hypothetical protein MZV70_11295 [Desulfobacterales bacterium]|nr:hypothetical protein [Desulfobacterales bacterium]
MAEDQRQEAFETAWPVYSIDDPRKIGDLMGAIHGIRHTGFIGEVYKQFPFQKERRNSSKSQKVFSREPG